MRSASRYKEILTGIRRSVFDDERIDPIPPQLIRMRSGTGFIAFDLLVGRRLVGAFHVKGGFTYGLAGDIHPFHPLLVMAWQPY